jgi:hypothetical protein
LPIGPKATFTIVASRVIIRKPNEIAVSPRARLRATLRFASNSIGSIVRLGSAVVHDA